MNAPRSYRVHLIVSVFAEVEVVARSAHEAEQKAVDPKAKPKRKFKTAPIVHRMEIFNGLTKTWTELPRD